MPDAGLFGGIWLQEVVERAGGSSADGMQHYGAGVHTVDPHALRDGARAQEDQDGGAFNASAEGQAAIETVKLLHNEEKSQWRQAAVLSASSRSMAMECGTCSAQ